MSRVLVTGADGFIGSHLVEGLLAAGHEVRAFCIYNSIGSWGWLDSLRPALRAELEVVLGDIRDPLCVREAMRGCDQVFHLAALIAIPLGIALGLSRTLHTAINPIIQIFKPVSPLAWLPLVTMVVSALYVTPDPLVAKSFLNSMITVTLCCLWPMLINTSVGVAGIDEDLVNVSRVLRLPTLKHIQKIVLAKAHVILQHSYKKESPR